MQLYNFFRSGTSHRLRIALNLKGLSYDYRPISLPREEHLRSDFRALNPQALVPALLTDEGEVLTQTPAILEWLEELYPEPPLLPADSAGRARVRALAAVVGCDIHPLNNRRVLEQLRRDAAYDEERIRAWCAMWIRPGFDAIEAILECGPVGRFCHGEAPTMADVYLVPQVESARRFGVALDRWPNISAVDQACADLDAFRRAAPAVQPDAA